MTYTINGIETGDVLRISQLTQASFDQQPPSGDLLALEACNAIEAMAATYLIDSLNRRVDFSRRGIFLHQRTEIIGAQISESGRLPAPKYSFERGFTRESLMDDEVLLMATFAAISMRGINVSQLKYHITNQLSKYRRLQNFAIASWTDILGDEGVGHSMAYLVDRIITEEKMSENNMDDNPVLRESRVAYKKGDNISLAVPRIENFLVSKWNTGHLVVGNFPTENNRKIVFSAVLPG